ncbi:DNA-binding response regulator [Lacihabitans sp. LS3-19]|uniref:response regulator transcription factor n=1 Tax=Lacihabitans sp. LS3-19 TaxID=2487335 RepID=UPI0020CEEA9F|nr:LuxR C-terminal-related transcriptional regulator [Lacihabitans sp. LS3-19]MCP9769213.1 DNA-binding response regulator [Lacihabitans sp. LS3-19]
MLSNREKEVLGLISEELTTKEIASKLGLSISTIESHRRNLFQKLKAKSSVGLIKEAIKIGLLTEL